MKKVILSFCLLVGVSYAASASIAPAIVAGETNLSLKSEIAVSTFGKEIVSSLDDEILKSCTVILNTTITAYGEQYPIRVTATAATCEEAGALAGAKADSIQSQYPY